MTTYLAFLRAINLGATRKFPKDAIRRTVEECGFRGVETHINTGNVRFDSPMRSRPRIESLLENRFAADRGFDVPTIVYRADEFARIAQDATELDAENPGLARHYVYLLKDEPAADVVRAVEDLRTEVGEMRIRGRAAHALLREGYEAGNVDPLGAVKLLGVATNRNANVVATLAEKWCR